MKEGSRMKKNLFLLCLFVFSAFIPGGCVKLAIRLSPSLVSDIEEAIFEECDPEMARDAIPANLKLLEGLLKSDPENRHVLLALCQSLSGYGMLFVEDEAPDRASALYLRARDFGIRALGEKGEYLRHPEMFGPDAYKWLKTFSEEDFEALFWVTLSWNAWVKLNPDKPFAIAHLPVLEACTQKITEMDGDYMYGLPWLLMGTALAARPPLFGGDLNRSKQAFERALKISQGRFHLVQYYYARYYAVRVQDKVLFFRLLRNILKGDPQGLKGVCLINAVAREKAKTLEKQAEELFF